MSSATTDSTHPVCPINGCDTPVTKIVRESELSDDEVLYLTLVDENESYRHYSNGLLVRVKQHTSYLQAPQHLPMGKFSEAVLSASLSQQQIQSQEVSTPVPVI